MASKLVFHSLLFKALPRDWMLAHFYFSFECYVLNLLHYFALVKGLVVFGTFSVCRHEWKMMRMSVASRFLAGSEHGVPWSNRIHQRKTVQKKDQVYKCELFLEVNTRRKFSHGSV